MADDELRQTVRAALAAGKLPHQRSELLLGGNSKGAECIVCAVFIERREVEIEVEYPSKYGAGTDTCHLHPVCFTAWELERQNGRAQLPHATDNGTIGPRGGQSSKTGRA
jgi:hypothetical protein